MQLELLVLFVFGLDTRAAAGEVLEAAGLQADHVEVLLLVQSTFVAFEVVDGLNGSFGGDH